MSRRYTYSRTLTADGEVETFTASEFDSFDEAKHAVDKGIADRRLVLAKEAETDRQLTAPETNKVNVPGHVTPGTTLPTSDNAPTE